MVPAGEILMLNGVMGGVCGLEVFRLQIIFDRFAECLFQDFGECAALIALRVEDVYGHLTSAADVDFDLCHLDSLLGQDEFNRPVGELVLVDHAVIHLFDRVERDF